MLIAVTGATGFLGRYIVNTLTAAGHRVRAWYRPGSDRGGFEGREDAIEWVPGDLADPAAAGKLVKGVDAVVHAALARQGSGWSASDADLVAFAQANIIGSLMLMQQAREAGAARFVFISTCAVHDRIRDDRPLDEAHPLWPMSHYGAHKAAVEKFVHSFGLGGGWPICALRPTGIYGPTRPVSESKWYDLVREVVAGRKISSAAGGKEVHAADVAKATLLLLEAPAERITGEAFNCYDMYIADQDVAAIARDLSASSSEIEQLNRGPKNQIETGKVRDLGMSFGGRGQLEQYVRTLLDAVQQGE